MWKKENLIINLCWGKRINKFVMRLFSFDEKISIFFNYFQYFHRRIVFHWESMKFLENHKKKEIFYLINK